MSLFNLINWWTGQVSNTNQALDSGTPPQLCVSRFNSFDASSDPMERDTIFIGSHTGMLSVYQPSDVFYLTGNQSPTDVILECQLNEPIIDIACGKFAITKSDKATIAILHPTRVVCYAVLFSNGLAEYGKQFQLSIVFESSLNSMGFSLCKGNFGGIKAKEFLCVNHVASNELQFFEQDGLTSKGYLPQAPSLPSRMVYLSRVDCFAIVSMPTDTLECYKYQDLITSNSDQHTAPVWSFCVGEFVLEMATHQIRNSESLIVILGEHNLICLTDGGAVKFIKKLDYTAMTIHSFVIGYYFEPDARLMIAIGSEMKTLFIYECSSSIDGPINCRLVWSTQLPFVPVSIWRASFTGMPGGLVMISENGQLDVSLFGTNPQIFKVPPPNDSDSANSQQIQQELQRLEQDIKQGIDFTDVSFINSATNRDLEITISSPPLITCPPHVQKRLSASSTESSKMMRVHVKLTPKIHYEQIQVAVNPPIPLDMDTKTIMFLNIEIDKNVEAQFNIFLANDQIPLSVSVPVIITLINRQGIPRVIEKSVPVPPELMLVKCTPQKESRYKLTINAEVSGPDILTLLPEFATDTINQSALGLRLIHSTIMATIVVGKKNGNRYRIQSDCLSLIALVAELVISRLLLKGPSIKTPDCISIDQSYFAEELFTSVNAHLNCRIDVKKYDKAISDKSRQMRLFQRKLMLMLQHDPPHPSFTSAGKLLRLTHADLEALQAELLSAVDGFRRSQSMLGNHLRLIKLVIHHSKIPPPIKDIILAVFVIPINDWIETSWEEFLAPALEMISHVGPLSKNRYDNTVDVEDIKAFSKMPFDLDRFNKNLKYVLERLSGCENLDLKEFTQRDSSQHERSDWLLGNKDDHSGGGSVEDRSVNDMELV